MINKFHIYFFLILFFFFQTNIVSSSGGRASKVENHPFKEVLQKVGEAFPGSAVAKQHTRRTAKEVKTKEIVDKHRKLQAKGKKNV